VAGAAAILLGVGIFTLGLTMTPRLTGIGFVLSGAAGVLSPVVVWQSKQKELRAIASLVLLATSAIWALIGLGGYWAHITAK
jgi:putative membrane protein